MELEFGAKVLDKNGRQLGTVDHLTRNTWTGEITKFLVRRKAPDKDLFLSLEDVATITKGTVKLSTSADELEHRE